MRLASAMIDQRGRPASNKPHFCGSESPRYNIKIHMRWPWQAVRAIDNRIHLCYNMTGHGTGHGTGHSQIRCDL